MAYDSTLTLNPAWLATYRSASPSGILSSVTVMRAPAGPDGAVFSDRLLPFFLHFPKMPGTRLVVRFFAVLVFSVVDFFLASARGSVVRVERQYPIVAFHRLVVLAGLIIAVGFGEETF